MNKHYIDIKNTENQKTKIKTENIGINTNSKY